MKRNTILLRDHPEWKEWAAAWFHSKWGVQEEAYLESMEDCLRKEAAVPQWYIVTEGERIVAGVGVKLL